MPTQMARRAAGRPRRRSRGRAAAVQLTASVSTTSRAAHGYGFDAGIGPADGQVGESRCCDESDESQLETPIVSDEKCDGHPGGTEHDQHGYRDERHLACPDDVESGHSHERAGRDRRRGR